jgi:predicted nucleic acid-binding protein
MKVVLDANVLIAFSRPDHVFHGRARAAIGAPSVVLIAHPVTLAEYLVHPARIGRTAEAFDWLVQRVGVEPASDSDLGGASWPITLAEVRAISGLKMPDAIVLATATAIKARIATYDGALLDAARSAGILFEPGDMPRGGA